MQKLPIGIQSFKAIRKRNYICTDKTSILTELISQGERYFLLRPRRFGKSLTLPTLEAMFRGQTTLFHDLAAEHWVQQHTINPFPVIHLDMSSFDSPFSAEDLNQSIISELKNIADYNKLETEINSNCGITFKNIIRALYKKSGAVVVLIDRF